MLWVVWLSCGEEELFGEHVTVLSDWHHFSFIYGGG